MKTPEERGPRAAWAYEVRADRLALSPEQVVERLGKYTSATIRKAEADEKDLSRPLWRMLRELYTVVAREQGVALPPLPPEPLAGSPSGDTAMGELAALLIEQTRAITALVDELRQERSERASAAERLERLQAVVDQLVERALDPRDTPVPQGHGAPQR